MRIPPLAVLALLLTLAPAHAQPPPAPAPPPGQPGPGAPPVPNDPQAVAAQFLTFARGLLTGEHGPHEQALAPLLANLPPADPDRHGPGDPQEMLMIFACAWSAWGAQPAGAQVEGDKATLSFQGAPLRLVMVKVDGKWKVDATATLAGFPESVRKMMGPPPPEAPPPAQTVQDTCLSNMKELDLSALMWSSDNDQREPDADKWTDEIMPYIKNAQILRCPAAPGLECGYAMYRPLSGYNTDDLERPAETVIFFESDLGHRNAAGTYADLPAVPRHNGGNIYAYADGHVKWSKTPPPQPPLPPLDPGARALRLECQGHLEQMQLAVRLYAAQHGQRLPDADKWTDEILPYLQDPAVLKCPDAPQLECAYAMNRALSGKPLSVLNKWPHPVLFFESDLGQRNASGTGADVAPGRHQGGNNYAVGVTNVQWDTALPASLIPPPTAPGAAGPAPPG